MFDSKQRVTLLKLARDAIVAYLERKIIISPPSDEFLRNLAAAFVTIKIDEELRGCIGSTDSTDPLGDTIIHCAISAAFRDPRFPPLTQAEYPLIDIEISVLSAFQRAAGPEDIIAGTHGVMITRFQNRGLLLPQVAEENNWDRDTFLSYSCRKAGLLPDAWKDPQTVIEIFTAEVFGEK